MVSMKSMLVNARTPKSEDWAADPGSTYHNGGLNIKPFNSSFGLRGKRRDGLNA
jgi:hypothetical protein